VCVCVCVCVCVYCTLARYILFSYAGCCLFFSVAVLILLFYRKIVGACQVLQTTNDVCCSDIVCV